MALNYFLTPKIRFITDCKTDKTMLNIKAVIKPSTSKPSTIFVQSNTINALMTKRNKPKVSTVTGKVKNTIIGYIKMFNNPSTTATINAVVKPTIRTPGIKCDKMTTRSAVTIIFMSKFIFVCF